MPELDSIIMQTSEQENNDEYSKEVQDQALSPKHDVKVDVQITLDSSSNAVTQGAIIALQPLYQKLNWLGCAGNHCGKAGCPRLFMEGKDWDSCWGEVFQIYRQSGPGTVKVGDVVGIYYPRGRKWFGGGTRKAGCPGNPTMQHGFASAKHWGACWGEVYQIYARGKRIGESIESHDAIAIYYIHAKRWVGLVGQNSGLSTCPGKTRPPPPDRYEICWGESFEIWLKN